MRMAGVVLAGGKSSRFGRPKMFEAYKGIQFYEHSINALFNSGVESIYIVTNDQLAPSFKNTKAKIIIEDESHHGPLYALSYAMRTIQDKDWFFVLAADIPLVSTDFVREMCTLAEQSINDIIIPISGDKEQPLLALYHRRCLPIALELLAENRKSMRPLIEKTNVKYVHFSSDQKDFININHQEDLAQIINKETT